MKDIKIEVKLRNNRLLELMESLGIKSMNELARKSGIPAISISRMCAFRNIFCSGPESKIGQYTGSAKKLADFFKVPCEYIFPKYFGKITRTRSTTDISFNDLKKFAHNREQFADPQLDGRINGLNTAIRKACEDLSEQERFVIQKRYEEGQTLDEIADEMGFTRVRISQIQLGALRKLRHVKRSQILVDYICD